MSEPQRPPVLRQPDEAELLERLLLVLAERGLVPFERSEAGDDLWVAPALARWLGCSVDELPHQVAGMQRWLHAEDWPRAAALLARPHEGEVALGRLAVDGGWLALHQLARAHRGADGSALVTGLWRLGDEPGSGPDPETLRLLGRASHEIRGPLTGLMGLLQLALRMAGNVTQQRYLDLALQSGRTLAALLERTMDLARVAGGMPNLQPQWIDLDAVLCDAVRAVTPTMGLKNFALVYDCDAADLEVLADPLALRQIVTNLFANAVRHTERGHVAVKARLRAGPEGRARAWLAVQDTGGGIAPARVQSLFEPFADAAQARRHGGHGLGLSIVKTLVDTMGGRIEVDSRVGEGTCITLQFDWPARAPADARPAAGTGEAWLLYPAVYAPSAGCLVERLARLGWRARIVDSLDAAIAQRATPPGLMLVAGLLLEPPGELERLSTVFPEVRKSLMSRLDWSKPTAEERALAHGWTVVPVPLGQRDLESLTRRAG